MGHKSGPVKKPAEQVVKEIRRATRRQYSAEQKTRIVLSGLIGKKGITFNDRGRGLGLVIPAGEIADALRSGAIDAAEYVGPWTDMWLGLDKVADYYYYPGFHEPGFNGALGINKTLWDALAAPERALLDAAAQAEATRSLAQFNAENIKSLKLLRADKRIKIRRFNDQLIKAFGKLSKEVLADLAAKDPLTRKVYDGYMAFLAGVMDWGELSETAYRNARRLALA